MPDSLGATRLPALREDLILQTAARGADGAPHWNLHDPVRNRFFRIGWLEFQLLSHWQPGMTMDALCAAACADSVLAPEAEDAIELLHFLESNELLRAASPAHSARLYRMAQQRQLSVWQWLLHHYLFIRLPLVQPDAFLRRTLPHLDFVFRPTFFLWVGALSLLGLIRVVDQWSAFSQTFLYFFSWQGALFYGLALSLAKLMHELAHAYTAKHFGLRVPTMGVAFMMLWPLLYTDTSEGWQLVERRARLAIDGAGVIAELLLAGLAALVWSVAPEGALKSAAYILAAVTWISTLAINLNPFMRFDGYYLLMDAVDMPNLHQRSFAFGRWHLRRVLLGLKQAVPEPEFETRRAALILYAYATWIYRLVIFTGIAAAVYYFFFKAAGIILFAVEIGWFVLRPIFNETSAWWKMRQRWRGNLTAWRNLLLVILLFIALAVPWRTEVGGHGYWQSAQHTRIYPPTAARIKKILVAEGQTVRAGQALFLLEAPEVEWQLRTIESRIAGLEAQLAGTVGNIDLMENARVLEQELAAAKAARTLEQDEQTRLQVAAPHDGVFRDLDRGLYSGAWVRPQTILGRVVGGQDSLAQIFVGEADVARLHIGAPARLLVRRFDTYAIAASVVGIDSLATRILPEPLLASTYGGPIAVRSANNGVLSANEALYRVTLKINRDQADIKQLTAVSARIEGEHNSVLWNFCLQAISVAIRESGF